MFSIFFPFSFDHCINYLSFFELLLLILKLFFAAKLRFPLYVELQSVTTFMLFCEARQRRVLDMLSKIAMSVSISGNDKSMVNISSILVCF